MDKFNRNTWVKVPEFDSAPLTPYPKHWTDGASLIKPKGLWRRANRNEWRRYFSC